MKRLALYCAIPIQVILGAICVACMGIYVAAQVTFDSWSDLVLWLKR